MIYYLWKKKKTLFFQNTVRGDNVNILFLTLSSNVGENDHGIYSDLLREFVEKGHKVFVVSPFQRRERKKTVLFEKANFSSLRVRILNITKTNNFEKGLSMLTIDFLFKRAISKYLCKTKMDLIIYSTPPITFVNTIKWMKRHDKCSTYLLLKDIFPQNAVDLAFFSKKSLVYKYFSKKEKKLYSISDKIGCMSPRNITYLLDNNKELSKDKVHLSPNCIEPYYCPKRSKNEIRSEYGIPLDKKVFIYGGNLGKPQGVDFIIDCLRSCGVVKEAFFVICGNGTEYGKIKAVVSTEKIENVKLINGLPKDAYNDLCYSCDVGLIFLDYRFTIPNFPSRLLSYLDVEIPVIVCSDRATDIGDFVVDNKIGWKCFSNSIEDFLKCVMSAIDSKLFHIQGKKIISSFFNVHDQYKRIIDSIKEVSE